VTILKKGYRLVARSWNGDLESDNSNVLVIAGPPVPPSGLGKK
jgi:hypothetical protein